MEDVACPAIWIERIHNAHAQLGLPRQSLELLAALILQLKCHQNIKYVYCKGFHSW